MITPGSGRAPPLPAAFERKPVQADEGDRPAELAGRIRLRGRYGRAGPHRARSHRSDAAGRAGVGAAPTGDRRAAGLRRLRDRQGRPLPRQRRARRLRRPARPDRPDQDRRGRAPTRPCRSSRALPAGASASTPSVSPPSRSRARRAGWAACSASIRPAASPSLADRAEVCVTGARLDEDLYVGTFAQTLKQYVSRRRRRARAAAVRAGADQVARPERQPRRIAAGDLRPEAHAGGEDPARLDARRQPVGDLHRHAHVRPHALRRPGRADPPGARARRAVHALGLAEGELRRGLPARRRARRAGRAARSTCAGRPSRPSSRSASRSCGRSASTA